MNIIIPKKELLKEFLLKRGSLKEDKLLYLLHIINPELAVEDKCFLDQRGGLLYIRLYSKLLKKNLGKNYRKYIDFWMDNKVIETNPKYSTVGGFSKSYRLKSLYNGEYEWVTIKDASYRRKLLNEERDMKVYPFLRKWIDLLKMDIEGASNEANGLLKQLGSEKFLSKQRNKYHNCISTIKSFNDKKTKFKPDNSGYRLHSKLTKSCKILRKYITFKGEGLVEVDLKNSQFYFLLYLFDINSWKRGKVINLYKGYSEYIRDKYIFNMLHLLDEIHASGEFEEYKNLVTDGTIYDFFQNIMVNKNPKITRDEVKDLLIIALFSQNEMPCSGMKTIFRSKFSNIYNFIKYIKSNKYDQNVERHSVMAILLQRIESHIVLNQVAKRINREKPEIPIFTIHDCLVTTVNNEAYFDAVLKDECFKLIGEYPKTKTKHWQAQDCGVICMAVGETQAA